MTRRLILAILLFAIFINTANVHSLELDKINTNNDIYRTIEVDTAIVHSINRQGSIEWIIEDEINIEKGEYPVILKWNISNHVFENRGESYQIYFKNIAIKNNGKESEAYIDWPIVEGDKNDAWFYFLKPTTLFTGLDSIRKITVEIKCEIGYFDSDETHVFSKEINVNLGRKNIENKYYTEPNFFFKNLKIEFNEFILKVLPLSRFEPTFDFQLHQK